MGGITAKGRRSGASWIGGEGDDDKPKIRWCPQCESFGFKERLGPRMLMKGETRPPDYDYWLQCMVCGRIYPKRETKPESDLTSDFTTTNDPSDIGQYIVGTGNKKPKTRRQKELQAIRDRIDAEPDEDIKRELRKGNTVEVLEGS